jgi:hypothetical protein
VYKVFTFLKIKSLALTYFPRETQVSSAVQSLTSVFGMGTGVTSALSAPGKLCLLVLQSNRACVCVSSFLFLSRKPIIKKCTNQYDVLLKSSMELLVLVS